MRLNSLEYECWHELGHATICLALGGRVEFVEMLGDDHPKGRARARCETTLDIRPVVLCGGFAAECLLFRNGMIEDASEKEFINAAFDNALVDRVKFFGDDKAGPNGRWPEELDREFMNFSIAKAEPVLKRHFLNLAPAVVQLCKDRRLDGAQIADILGLQGKLK